MGAKTTKILVVDDDPTQRRLLKKIFEEGQGYELFEAEDGLEALNLILGEEKIPNLVLLDLVMPKIDGVEFLRIIRNKKEFEKLPIVVCSVVENADTVRQVMEFGISDFVAKPVDRVTLSKKLTKIIHSHKKDQGVAENPIFVE